MSAELNDNSPFPFGEKFRGEPMIKVPAWHLHWVWTQCLISQRPENSIHKYIKKNLGALRKEYPNGIW